jgi:hypothetical protein
MMQKKNIFIFISIIFNIGCLPIDKRYSIWIRNNSSNNIYFHVSTNYPDTSLPNTDEYVIKVKPESKRFIDSSEPWEKRFSSTFPRDTLLIFFFDADTISKYSWQLIRDKHKILEKRMYGKVELNNNDWNIYYP